MGIEEMGSFLKEFNEWISIYPYEGEAIKEKELVETVKIATKQ